MNLTKLESLNWLVDDSHGSINMIVLLYTFSPNSESSLMKIHFRMQLPWNCSRKHTQYPDSNAYLVLASHSDEQYPASSDASNSISECILRIIVELDP